MLRSRAARPWRAHRSLPRSHGVDPSAGQSPPRWDAATNRGVVAWGPGPLTHPEALAVGDTEDAPTGWAGVDVSPTKRRGHFHGYDLEQFSIAVWTQRLRIGIFADGRHEGTSLHLRSRGRCWTGHRPGMDQSWLLLRCRAGYLVMAAMHDPPAGHQLSGTNDREAVLGEPRAGVDGPSWNPPATRRVLVGTVEENPGPAPLPPSCGPTRLSVKIAEGP